MSEKSESRRIDGGDPPKSPLKRGTLRNFSPLFKGGWGGSKQLVTLLRHPLSDRPLVAVLAVALEEIAAQCDRRGQ
jgi:hypothetical protein